jgi:hypothetical protein
MLSNLYAGLRFFKKASRHSQLPHAIHKETHDVRPWKYEPRQQMVHDFGGAFKVVASKGVSP